MEKKRCTVSAEDLKRVKGFGFLQNRGTDKFNCRVITRNGRITAKEAALLSEAAEKFGDGHMMCTTRLTVELSGIPYENIDPLIEFLGKGGLTTGGTGTKVRPVVSCKGTTCIYGLYDTYALSSKVHERFYEGYRSVTFPHKVKIATGGCPNNCVKPEINDIGVIGYRKPLYDAEKCKACKKCKIEEACPMKAAKVADGKINIDENVCINCGRCIGKCPFGCFEDHKDGFRLSVGGRWGKQWDRGKTLTKILDTEEEVLDTIEKAMLFFKKYGEKGERFAAVINRVGFDFANETILSDAMIKEKEEILAK